MVVDIHGVVVVVNVLLWVMMKGRQSGEVGQEKFSPSPAFCNNRTKVSAYPSTTTDNNHLQHLQ